MLGDLHESFVKLKLKLLLLRANFALHLLVGRGESKQICSLSARA